MIAKVLYVDDEPLNLKLFELYSSKPDLALYPVNKKEGYSIRCIKNSDKEEKTFDFWE